jgi:hypothetical protein
MLLTKVWKLNGNLDGVKIHNRLYSTSSGTNFVTEFSTKLSKFKENVKKKTSNILFWGILEESYKSHIKNP